MLVAVETVLEKALGQEVSQPAASEKQLLLSRLLGRLAHEIRNPLGSLDIHVQLLQEDLAQMAPALQQQLAGRLDIIHGELHRLNDVVKQFLRLASPSSLSPAPVQVARMMEQVCELLAPEAATRQIEITSRAPGDLPVVMADSGQLTQALLNLVINALQAVERQGQVQVQAALDNGAIVVQVRDTGPGLPPGKVDAIFEPYYTTKPEGSGLGLWIAQQIITAHGGDLWAANAPGGGAVFAFRLPLRTTTGADGQVQDQNPGGG
jgi:two-component system sensor histidine kinase HydH